MRQAGRYLPEYRALRQRHSLWELFHTPELAAEVTMMPLHLLHLDAAILFSDILVIAEALGLATVFPETGGPRIEPLVQDVQQIKTQNVEEKLQFVAQTIRIVKPQLKVPLIGFCGGPFTVAQYMTKKNRALSLHPELLQPLTDVTISYLQMQIEAGVEAVQIFDSWANLLSPEEFLAYSQKYLQKIVDALRPTNIPVILFCRGSCGFAQELSALKPHAISLDWEKPLADMRRVIPKEIAVQGNFPPELLLTSFTEIRTAVEITLRTITTEAGYIANLGHGVLPTTPVDNVRCFIDAIKNY